MRATRQKASQRETAVSVSAPITAGPILPGAGAGADPAHGRIDEPADAHLTPARMFAVLAALVLLTTIAAVAAASLGSVSIDLRRALVDSASADHAIFFGARLPRVLMGLIVGAILAAVGAALQALVRNPLAEGGILGISGAGALGAILALIFGAHLGGSALLVPLCSFGMALLSTVAVYRLGQVEGRLEPFSLLLVGVIFNAMWGAAILLVNSLVNFYHAHSILFWLMGSLEAPTIRETLMVAILGLGGFVALLFHARDMNLMSLGDDAAAELGVEIDKVRRTIFVATSLMLGAAVSVSGMIGFVGLIVPHLLRLALGPDHRLLLPASLLGGAAFLVGADLIARTIIAPAELPVGVITALCGGPFFIFLLRREGRRSLAQ
jgi:iron complex transport system permease protein